MASAKTRELAVNKNIVVVAILSVVCIVAGTLIALLRRASHYQRAYDDIARGTPKSQVVQNFGRPEEVRPCTLKMWDEEPIKGSTSECVEEIWYYSRISPEQWVIGFDKDGLAIAKYHMVSR